MGGEGTRARVTLSTPESEGTYFKTFVRRVLPGTVSFSFLSSPIFSLLERMNVTGSSSLSACYLLSL